MPAAATDPAGRRWPWVARPALFTSRIGSEVPALRGWASKLIGAVSDGDGLWGARFGSGASCPHLQFRFSSAMAAASCSSATMRSRSLGFCFGLLPVMFCSMYLALLATLDGILKRLPLKSSRSAINHHRQGGFGGNWPSVDLPQ